MKEQRRIVGARKRPILGLEVKLKEHEILAIFESASPIADEPIISGPKWNGRKKPRQQTNASHRAEPPN